MIDVKQMAEGIERYLYDHGWTVSHLGGLLKATKDGHKFHIQVTQLTVGKKK